MHISINIFQLGNAAAQQFIHRGQGSLQKLRQGRSASQQFADAGKQEDKYQKDQYDYACGLEKLSHCYPKAGCRRQPAAFPART